MTKTPSRPSPAAPRSRNRQRVRAVFVVPLVAVLVGGGAVTAVAASDSTLVVGVPRAGTSGAVDNRMAYGAAQSIDLAELEQADRPGSRFGAAVLSGIDLLREDSGGPGNNPDELVVGAPGSPADGIAGQVFLLHGDVDAFQKKAGLEILDSHAGPGDEFGAALSVSPRYDAAGGTDLWVGAPGTDVNGQADAGAVLRYLVAPDGRTTYLETITQASPAIPGSPEAGDRFGEVMGLGGMVGVPHEDIGSLQDAGTVQFLRTDPDTHALVATPDYNQARDDVSGVAEAGDRFGAAISGNAIGVPGEDVGSVKDAGQVQQIGGRSFTQATAGVPGALEAGDQFGASLSRGPMQCLLQESLAIGSPGEDVGEVADAGTVTLVLSRAPEEGTPACPAQVIREGDGELPGTPEAGDRFGAALGEVEGHLFAGDPDFQMSSLLIGVPGQDVGTAKDVGRVISREWESLRTFSYATFGFAGGDTAGLRYGSVMSPSS